MRYAGKPSEVNPRASAVEQRARALLVALACSACTHEQPAATQAPPRASRDAPATLPPSGSIAAPSTQLATPGRATRPLLLVTDVSVLQALSRSGLALAQRLGLDDPASDLHTLSAAPRFASVVRALEADVRTLAARDPSAGVSVARHNHRLFDARWLRSQLTHFELIAVSVRPDRAAFVPRSSGELRLVYRLVRARESGERVSPLPLTLALEYALPEERDSLASFVVPEELSGAALARHLTRAGGALAPERLRQLELRHRLTVNLQLVRWPSGVRPDLGGHAEYRLRSFDFTARGYTTGALENTPDVPRLQAEPALRRELLAWIRDPERWVEVDQGTLLLPTRFLATASSSFSPRGLARLANRPFSQLYTAADFQGLPFARGTHVKSPEGLLRRLDSLTCAGCHQARSVAGFHLLGAATPEDLAGNTLQRAASPHTGADLSRRERVFRTRLGNDRVDYSLPFPERGSIAEGGYGDHCGVGDPSFAGWLCRPDLVCTQVDEAIVGQCLPRRTGSAGDPCETGTLTRQANPVRDRIAERTRARCGPNAVCNRGAVGFPAGMCTESCADLSQGARCGAIAVLDPFNACLARKEAFATCLGRHSTPAGLRACDADDNCRDDYVCAALQGGGVCIPPYFLFQLRVDGHE